MKKYLAPIVIVLIGVLVAAVLIFNNQKSVLREDSVLKMADSTKEALFLNDLIKSQNRFAQCINEIAIAYKNMKGVDMPVASAAKTGQCLITVGKQVSDEGNGIYIVDYTQNLPEACKSSRTLSDLLKVQVDTVTSITQAEWQSGIVMSQSAVDDTEASLKPADCKGYADYITTHGSFH